MSDPTTAEDEQEALRQEWYAMHRELVAKMGGEFAGELETNFGMRAAGDLNPLLDGLRAIDSLLATLPAEEAIPLARTIAGRLVEQYDPSA